MAGEVKDQAFLPTDFVPLPSFRRNDLQKAEDMRMAYILAGKSPEYIEAFKKGFEEGQRRWDLL